MRLGQECCLIYFVGSAGVFANIGAGDLAGLTPRLVVVQEFVERAVYIGLRAHFATTARSKEFARLSEFSIIRPNEDGKSIHGGLRHVVNPHTKAPANVSYGGVAINGSQQAIAINNQAVGRGGDFGRSLCVAKGGALKAGFNLLQMGLIYDMGR